MVKIIGIYKKQQAKLLNILSSYLPYSEICKIHKIKPSALSMSFKRFKERGWINQDRTLTQAGIQLIKCVNRDPASSECVNTIPKGLKQDTVRGHDLVFTISLPYIHNWRNRREYLEFKDISFRKLDYMGSERIIIDKRKIWLTPISIVVFMGKSYFEDTSEECMGKALDDLFNILHKLENKLQAKIRHADGYKIRVSRQHYSLVKNALARQYNEARKKLYVRDRTGLWLVVDDSLHLDELETVHSKTGLDDNRPVQDFFNDLKENPATISQINNAVMSSIQMQDIYNQNVRKHLGVLDSMQQTLKEIREELKKR